MEGKIRYEILRCGWGNRTRQIKKGLPFVNNNRAKLIHAVRSAAIHVTLNTPHMSVGAWCGAGFSGSAEKLHLTSDPNDGGKLFCKRCYDAKNYQVDAVLGRLQVQEIKSDNQQNTQQDKG